MNGLDLAIVIAVFALLYVAALAVIDAVRDRRELRELRGHFDTTIRQESDR